MRDAAAVRWRAAETFIVTSYVIKIPCNKPRQGERGGKGKEVLPELQART